ncbi:TNF receptor-associated factor 3 isoform X1 [Phycodurus eques]|uniref:TNF receptor-associated factor 3 isoform X1 n=1 Tax=Phycodurus eques TaxID=693459 RepID=UPI002ACE1B99|nr:TNF receptor-associated factor 3 isoform X1 [Phycodurus eques]
MSAGRSVEGREVQLPLQQVAPSLIPPLSAAPPVGPPPNRPANPWPPGDSSQGAAAGFLPQDGGFTDRFVDVPEEKYRCESCRLVLCQPRQTECGHRFCQSCIAHILSRPNPVCPADMEPLFSNKIFRDVCCHREILALKVYCRAEAKGCQEQMSLQQMPEHLNVCPFFEVPCPLGKCKERMMRKDIPEHLGRKCKHRETACDFCLAKMPLTDLQKHKETVCPAFPVSCPNLCSFSSLPRSEFRVYAASRPESAGVGASTPATRQEEKGTENAWIVKNYALHTVPWTMCCFACCAHLDHQLTSHQHECPKAQVSCPFQRYGCAYKALSPEVRQHEAACAAEHLRMMMLKNVSLESKVEEVKCELLDKCKSVPLVSSRLCEAEKQNSELRDKHRHMEQKVASMQKVMSAHSEKLLEAELELRSLASLRDELDKVRLSLDAVRARLGALEQGGRSGTGTLTLASLETQQNRHGDMLSVHDIRLADMDLRFQVLETASYNGTLIWKIRDYKRRKQEAVAAKTLSLYSQPFYTGYFGYKMCARVYLNGDGMGKGTHLSLFFVVMRGEYDALLPWPFKQKVTLMLMDQGPARKHLGDAFKPDPNSSSFRRPAAEMNIASGCPLFVSQSVLESASYIKDDTIFIKVTVDTSDLPDP